MKAPNEHILITGAAGYIGSQLTAALGDAITSGDRPPGTVFALDIRPPETPHPRVAYLRADIRSSSIFEIIQRHRITTLIHLAAVVTPPKGMSRKQQYSIDVEGTENLLKASVAQGVKRFIITSSGAAYGFYKDNPVPLTENNPIRGNRIFGYAYHKRLIENMLAHYREQHPELQQVIFRVGTILGDRVTNQITALFDKKVVFRIAGSESPFVFIWDEDVVRCLIKAIDSTQTGVYNVAGDGVLSLRDIARELGKPLLTLPGFLLKTGLFFLKSLGLSPYGPAQTRFLRYRPVLSNEKLKSDFQFIPQKSTADVFKYYLQNRKP